MERLISLEVYITDQGRKPFTEWLNRIEDIKTRAIIRARLNRIRLGNFGDCHSVGDGVLEFRIDYGPGYRIYFGRVGLQVILLLCAGQKRTQRNDIERAKRHWMTYLEES